MPKPKVQKFYAVQKGRETGVFLFWSDCEKQTKGYPGAKYQSFQNAADAEAFVAGTLSSAPTASSSSSTITSDLKRKKPPMLELADQSKYDVVYSDGACKGNGKPGSVAGIGVWWGENDPRNIAERCPGDQTNNRAELIAIVRVLESTPRNKKPLLIKTDSQYSIKCFAQWLPNWARNNFRTANGEPVKNVGVIKYISALISARGLLGQEVRLEYVKGHSGDRGNDGADAQANLGALKPVEPERDWEKAEKEVTRSAEEEHSASLDKPKPVPLQVVADELAQPGDPPRKVRKANHDLSFSRLPSASISTKPTSARSRSPPHVISPSPPPRIVEVSSSPPRGTQPSQVRPAPTAERTVPLKATVSSGSRNDQTTNGVSAQSSTRKSHRSAELVKTPIRRHGVGLFSTTPPPNAGFVKKFLPLPSASQRARELGLVLALPEDVVTPTKVTAMSVNAADVNLDDYLDCVDDDDVPFDDI